MLGNISKLVNKITDRGSGRESGDSTASGSMSFVETEEQHSEGFLCPPCMRAFPSPEALEAHYNSTHVQIDTRGGDLSPNELATNGEEDFKMLREEIQNLQLSLAEEQVTSEELKREVHKMQAGLQKDGDSLQAQEKEFEGMKTLLHSEVTLLRKQLTDSLEQISIMKKEKEETCRMNEMLKSETEALKATFSNLEAQLAHKNSLDDAVVLKQELVSVQRLMDELALEKEKEVEDLKTTIRNLQEADQTSSELEAKLAETIKQLEAANNHVNQYKSNVAKLDSTHEAALNQSSEKVKQLETQLNDSIIRNSEFQKKCATLKEEVKRLNDQHSELYRRVEGGEGAKAALEALQQENDILKANITALNQKNVELTSSLQQQENAVKTGAKLQTELKLSNENLQKEIKAMKDSATKLNQANSELTNKVQEQKGQIETMSKQEKNSKQIIESITSENQELKANISKSANVLKEKDLSIKQLEQQCNNLSNDLNQKVSELSAMREQHESVVAELTSELQDLRNFKERQDKRLAEVEAEKESLLNVTTALKETEKTLLNQLEQQFKEYNQVSKSLKDVQSRNAELEQNLSNAEQQNTDIQTAYKAQIAELEGKLNTESEVSRTRIEQLENMIALKETEVKEAKASLEKVKLLEQDKSKKLDELETNVETFKSKSQESESKMQVLQLQTDTVLGEKIELEKRLKSTEEEKALLLEKCLSGESDMEQIQQKLHAMQRKLDDSYAALQELGRENQSLQMESAKLQGRKWADDSVVPACSACSKEFTLTIRKHHCRHCGMIFCNECSSRTAAVPSCKKPARVCDPCYQELLTK